MSQSLALVSLVVRDYDEALAFYVGVLGFELVEDTPQPGKRWVVVAPRGSAARLLLARAKNAEEDSRIGNQTGGRVFLFLYTDDFDRDYRMLRSKGVEFVRGPTQESYGTVAVFKDLYGTLWDLIQPKPGTDHVYSAVAGTGQKTWPVPGFRNVEIKARVSDLAAVEARARAIATEAPVDLAQDDTFFACARGRLKLRQFGDGRGELIHYVRPDAAGPKTSDYVKASTGEPDALRELLARALGTAGRVRKRRRVYMVDRTRIHLDEVEGLGSFVELEVMLSEGEPAERGEAVARDIMARLGIEESQLVEGAYADLGASHDS